jgi:hypothetical protein
LSSASKYQLIASGILSTSGYTPGSTAAPFNLIANASVRERAQNANNTDVLVFHGATDAPAVNVAALGSGNIVSNISYGNYNSAGYLPLPSNTSAGNYTLFVTNTAGTATVASYGAPLNTLNLAGSAITVLASGFLAPANNSNGPAFGLWVATAAGGSLIPLPSLAIPTGISEKSELRSTISVYPNPFSNSLSIKNDNKNIEVSLFDLTGKLVSVPQAANAGVTELNTSNLENGIYLLKINSEGNTITYKIVK